MKAKWESYKTALQREEGRTATDDEIVGAFLLGVPLWQADLMLRAYLKHPLDIQADDEEIPPDSSR
ncbi:MAG TPA: hypothetical protein VFY37_06570 [Solirubrobacterales bacterium]|nr:hypothetical protein [Solirubrobacterales bacterium]